MPAIKPCVTSHGLCTVACLCRSPVSSDEIGMRNNLETGQDITAFGVPMGEISCVRLRPTPACSCGVFKSSGIPCVHLAALCYQTSVPITHAVHKAEVHGTYRESYEENFEVPTPDDLKQHASHRNEKLALPPALARTHGRPRTKRGDRMRQGRGTGGLGPNLGGRGRGPGRAPGRGRGQGPRCQRCGQTGHISSTCSVAVVGSNTGAQDNLEWNELAHPQSGAIAIAPPLPSAPSSVPGAEHQQQPGTVTQPPPLPPSWATGTSAQHQLPEPEGQDKRKKYKCSFCKTVGHNKRTCPILRNGDSTPEISTEASPATAGN